VNIFFNKPPTHHKLDIVKHLFKCIEYRREVYIYPLLRFKVAIVKKSCNLDFATNFLLTQLINSCINLLSKTRSLLVCWPHTCHLKSRKVLNVNLSPILWCICLIKSIVAQICELTWTNFCNNVNGKISHRQGYMCWIFELKGR
jgi:hypothetical protein